MADPFKICPICNSPNHRNAAICSTCGATLSDVELIKTQPRSSKVRVDYDYRHGETDLAEGNLRRTGKAFLMGGILLLIVLIFGGLFFTLGPRFFSSGNGGVNPTTDSNATPRPTFVFATVTPGPPTLTRTPTPEISDTPTITPSPEPCVQRVQSGDNLSSLAMNCGHRSLDVIPLIQELNGIDNPAGIQIGQEIIIPWPTPTVDPNPPAPTEPADDSSPDTTDEAGVFSESEAIAFDPFAPPPTKTLQPGVMWHQVKFGENIISIALEHRANVEILSQLNPEVQFSQCDFGLDSGGGSCVVNLFEGQLLRVPAPTPTPTLSPTPSGSETATPTITPTYNAPNAISPNDRALFQRDELVTLRWVTTGILTANQTYRVKVKNITSGETLTADTVNLYLVVPVEWQGKENKRYEYQWTVSVVEIDRPDEPYFTTTALTFIWQGRGN